MPYNETYDRFRKQLLKAPSPKKLGVSLEKGVVSGLLEEFPDNPDFARDVLQYVALNAYLTGKNIVTAGEVLDMNAHLSLADVRLGRANISDIFSEAVNELKAGRTINALLKPQNRLWGAARDKASLQAISQGVLPDHVYSWRAELRDGNLMIPMSGTPRSLDLRAVGSHIASYLTTEDTPFFSSSTAIFSPIGHHYSLEGLERPKGYADHSGKIIVKSKAPVENGLESYFEYLNQ